MADIFDFGSSGGANSAAGDLFEEGIAAASLSDNLRELQAAMRRAYNDAEWVIFGSGSRTPTFTFISATQFRITGDQRTAYHVGRAVRARGATTGTIYGNISAVSFAGSTTTVTVNWKNGASLKSDADLQIAVGILSADPSSLPIAPASSAPGAGGQTVTGDLTVTGNASIAGLLRDSGNREFVRVVQRRSYEFAGGTTSSTSYVTLAGDALFTPRRTNSRVEVHATGRAQVLEAAGSQAAGDLTIANSANVPQSAEPRFQITMGGANSANWLGTFDLRVVLVPASTAQLAFRLLAKLVVGDTISALSVVITITEFLDS